MRLAPRHWIVSLLCSQPTDACAPGAFSSFLWGSWRCILLRKFTFHPYGSMACVGARAIAVSGVQFRTVYEDQICEPHARRYSAGILAGFGTTERLFSEVRVSHALHSNCTPLRGARGVPLFFQVSRYSPNQHLRSLDV